MREYDVKTLEDAFLYLSDCQFATMEDLFFKKSTSKSEMDRQEGIGLKFVKWAKEFNVSLKNNGRMEEFILSGKLNYREYLKEKYSSLQTKF